MKRYPNFGFGQKQTKMGKPLKAEQKKNTDSTPSPSISTSPSAEFAVSTSAISKRIIQTKTKKIMN